MPTWSLRKSKEKPGEWDVFEDRTKVGTLPLDDILDQIVAGGDDDVPYVDMVRDLANNSPAKKLSIQRDWPEVYKVLFPKSAGLQQAKANLKAGKKLIASVVTAVVMIGTGVFIGTTLFEGNITELPLAERLDRVRARADRLNTGEVPNAETRESLARWLELEMKNVDRQIMGDDAKAVMQRIEAIMRNWEEAQ